MKKKTMMAIATVAGVLSVKERGTELDFLTLTKRQQAKSESMKISGSTRRIEKNDPRTAHL